MPLPLLSLVPALTSIGTGLWEKITGDSALKKLSKQKYPEFQLSPQLRGAYDRAEQLAQRGYTGKETAAFQSDAARNLNTQLGRAQDIGGGSLSRVISGIGNIQGIAGANEFARNNAVLKRQNIRYADTLAQALQHQDNLKTQSQIARRNALEQAYGTGSRIGMENIMNGINYGALAGLAGQQSNIPGSAAGAEQMRLAKYGMAGDVAPMNGPVFNPDNMANALSPGAFSQYGQLSTRIPQEEYYGQ